MSSHGPGAPTRVAQPGISTVSVALIVTLYLVAGVYGNIWLATDPLYDGPFGKCHRIAVHPVLNSSSIREDVFSIAGAVACLWGSAFVPFVFARRILATAAIVLAAMMALVLFKHFPGNMTVEGGISDATAALARLTTDSAFALAALESALVIVLCVLILRAPHRRLSWSIRDLFIACAIGAVLLCI